MALKPPKNYRVTLPKCCVTCKHYVEKVEPDEFGGIPSYSSECEREENLVASEEADYFKVCDYWKAQECTN